MSKRRYAYITAPWSENPWENVERADKLPSHRFQGWYDPCLPRPQLCNLHQF